MKLMAVQNQLQLLPNTNDSAHFKMALLEDLYYLLYSRGPTPGSGPFFGEVLTF